MEKSCRWARLTSPAPSPQRVPDDRSSGNTSSVILVNREVSVMRTPSIALVVLATLCRAPALAAEAKADRRKESRQFHAQGLSRPAALARPGSARTRSWCWRSWAPSARWQSCMLRGWSSWPSNTSRKGVVFLGIDSNRQDAVTEIAAYAEARNRLSDSQGPEPGRWPIRSAPRARRRSSCSTPSARFAIAAASTTSTAFKSNINYQKKAADRTRPGRRARRAAGRQAGRPGRNRKSPAA